MDPLTHTLVGANLGSTRLAGTTRLSAAACIIGANLPDLDAVLYFTGHDDLALGFRRGWTHGILALVVLPLALTGLLLAYDRLRPDPARKVSAGWLLALSSIAILTHPSLDWLNNYGMRWLMPFDGRWSYGDSVFIMDPLLWIVLGVGWLAGRRASWRVVGLWGVFTLAVAWVVGGRSPGYLALVAAIALVLLAALLWSPGGERERTRRAFARGALVVAAVYIAGRLATNEAAEHVVRDELLARGVAPIEKLMASPHPIDPRRWDLVAQTSESYRYGVYEWPGGGLELASETIPRPRPSPEWDAARRHPSVRGFMTWVRFPWYEVERTPEETRVWIYDARYARRRTGRGFGGELVVLPNEGSRTGE
ncbi:MAG TPA: metal-dependent hydrolase [Thermoanaerobaculia bacterium]|nr:metal-dependent hydrolase [Thermoanaerobaculia bacterium]